MDSGRPLARVRVGAGSGGAIPCYFISFPVNASTHHLTGGGAAPSPAIHRNLKCNELYAYEDWMDAHPAHYSPADNGNNARLLSCIIQILICLSTFKWTKGAFTSANRNWSRNFCFLWITLFCGLLWFYIFYYFGNVTVHECKCNRQLHLNCVYIF